MKAVLPFLVILPLSVVQTPAALAGSQSILDPYANIEAPPSKKTKGHPKTDAVKESILDEAGSTAGTPEETPKHAEKAPKPVKAAKPATGTSTDNGGIMTGIKNVKERSAETFKTTSTKLIEGTKAASTKLVAGSKAAGSKIAEKTKTLREDMAEGAKTSGEYLKKGAVAVGHGLQATTGKVKETASALESKIKPTAAKTISAKPTDITPPTQQATDVKPLDGLTPAMTPITSKDGFPGKPLEPVSPTSKQHTGLLTNAFSKLKPFGHKPTAPTAQARPIDQSKAATLDFSPSTPAATPAEPN